MDDIRAQLDELMVRPLILERPALPCLRPPLGNSFCPAAC